MFNTLKGTYNLSIITQEIFPSHEVFMEYSHTGMLYSKTKRPITFDVCIQKKITGLTVIDIPSLSIAFEYHGSQHYRPHFMFGSYNDQRQRDQEKREACLGYGITVIEVPYWWDLSKESLMATIKKYSFL